jgi:hypothetical protein
MNAHVGDHIIVESERVGVKAREGRILEVIGTAPDERYLVRWDDGRESTVYPHAGSARIVETDREPQRT